MARMNTHDSRRRNRIRRGLSTTELALILPVLLWLTFGVMEYGWMFLKMQELTNAARQGARVASRPDATLAEVEGSIHSALEIAGFEQDRYRIEYPDGSPIGADSGTVFGVAVIADYVDIELGMPLIPKPPLLSATIRMIKEGP